ncbi:MULTISPECIES: S8 family serine peptidase [Myxococcus]|uniref:S8 family serine peptidase n=1 Tax=Myxococcus TaxID=32 RepID=UPI0013D420FB|nr:MULTISPECIES: S8 family serine peptidase [Myxococcus]NVJ20191.1 S8 family serine peptidase [Myxococcus sp. AM011]
MRPQQTNPHRLHRLKPQALSLLALLTLGWSSGCEEQRSAPAHVEGVATSRQLARLGKAPAHLRIPDEYVVVFSEGVTGLAIEAVTSRIARAGGDNALLHAYTVIPGFAARLDEAQLDRLRREPGVAYIEENQQVSLSAVYPSPADGVDRSDQRKGHDGHFNDYGNTGAGVHAYVLDTGLNLEHSEFTGRIGTYETFILDGRGIADCHGHGTHVASTLAGTTYGMAREATLHPVRVLRCNGLGSWAGIIAGLDFVQTDCRAQSARCVANMSLTGSLYPPVNAAVANLVNGGIPVVVAAGNDDLNACTQSPASEPAAITVAAIDDNDVRAGFSNWGSCVDLFAPGVSILGAWIGGAVETQVDDGTSMASPHVAGTVAQYLSTRPTATPAQIDTNLKAAATLGCVSDLKGSPNVLLFSDLSQGNYHCIEETASCKGLCGQAADGCFCDPSCLEFNDCCPDFEEVCQ